MNLKNLIVLPVAALCLAACNSPSEKVIERPLTGVRNSRTIEIDKIVLTDTATLMYVDAFFNPGMWIRIDTSAYLYGGGRKYMITGAEGIELRENHWMPESGEDSFVLFFEPVDRRLKTIDFIEGEPDDYFKIFDIQLKNKRASDKHLASIPKEVRNADYRTAALPEPVYNSAETTVKIHLLGEPGGYPMQPEIYLSGIMETEDGPEPESHENGVYTYLIPLYGPSQMSVNVGVRQFRVVLEPGVENNVWVDMVALSRKESRYDKDRAETGPAVFTDNRYAVVNVLMANDMTGAGWTLDMLGMNYNELTELLEMGSAGAAQNLRGRYDDLALKIETDGSLSELEKEFIKARLDGAYIFGLSQVPFRIIPLQKQKLGLAYHEPLPDGVAPFEFSKEDYGILYGGLDPASLPNIYADYPGYGYYGLNDRLYEMFDLRNSFADHVKKTQEMIHAIDRMDVPAEVQARFDSVSEPALKDAVALKRSVIEKKIEEARAKTGYRICNVPDAQDATVFDAIMARYAGKVVVADFWATWCGPCRAAMKNHEPHKDTYLDKDVAFVYITGETSPRKQWEVDIASIRGDHYYLTEKQWRAVCDRFEIRGIPSWVVVTKSGEYVQEELYSASDWEAVINRELAK